MKKKNSYDFICFDVLVYEYDPSLKEVSEKKIKQRLRYHKAGKYDQGRIEYIRSLCKDLKEEVRLMEKSKYFKKTNSEYADMKDFNTKQMKEDY